MTSPHRLTALLVLALVGVLGLTAGCGGSGTTTPTTKAGQCRYVPGGGPVARKVAPPPSDPPSGSSNQVTIVTDRGSVPVTLDPSQAPCAVNSLLSLAKQGYFDNTRCDRLTHSATLSLLQCGDPSNTGQGGPGYLFADELVDRDPRLQPCYGQVDPSTGRQICTYNAGTVAMANAGPDTNGSQFFLIYRNSVLPAAYTVLGQMSAAGLKVVQSIARAGTVPGSEQPRQPVTITSLG